MSKNPYPMRMCVSCRQSMDKTKLCRIVYIGDGKAIADAKGTMSGRGAYICPKDECIKIAVKKKPFSRAFRTQIDDSIYEDLRKLVLGE